MRGLPSHLLESLLSEGTIRIQQEDCHLKRERHKTLDPEQTFTKDPELMRKERGSKLETLLAALNSIRPPLTEREISH